MGIAAVLIAALFAACGSDPDQSQTEPQPGPAQGQQEQPAQPAQPQESAPQQDQSPSSTAEPTVQRQDKGDKDQNAASGQQSAASNLADVDKDDDQQASDDQADDAQAGQQVPAQQTQPQTDAQSAERDDAQQEQVDERADESEPTQPSESAASEPGMPSERERLQMLAEEIVAQASVTDLVGLNGWLNGEETSIALELAKGNVVLVDFWTYTCINCVRTLPFLTAWDAKYRDHGLVILGVHTPEFEFEKNPDNIRAAIDEHGIEYDVPMDNDYRTWRAFNNRYWPAKYLIGPTDDSPMGVRYFHFGEGHYEETEEQIRQALEAVGRDLSDIPFGVNVDVPTRADVARGRQTRELYGGWRRNVGGGGPYAGQEAYFLAGLDAEHLYRDVERDQREHNRWYLEGLWRAELEAIAHARATGNLEDYLALSIRARTVNVVLTVAENGEPYDVYVQFNDAWIRDEFAGEHIRWDEAGRSYIRVDQNDLYRLVFFEDFTEGEIKLSSNSDQFRMFAFTFGSYVGGE